MPAAEIASLIESFLPGVDRAALIATIGAYQRLGTWEHDARITPEAYERTVDLFVWNGDIAGRPPYAAVVQELSC